MNGTVLKMYGLALNGFPVRVYTLSIQTTMNAGEIITARNIPLVL